MLQNVWQDVRYGFRGLVTRPGSRSSRSLTLALGIGSAAAIFSVIQNVLLDPAPYTDVDRIAYVQIRDASRSEPGGRTAFQVAGVSRLPGTEPGVRRRHRRRLRRRAAHDDGRHAAVCRRPRHAEHLPVPRRAAAARPGHRRLRRRARAPRRCSSCPTRCGSRSTAWIPASWDARSC